MSAPTLSTLLIQHPPAHHKVVHDRSRNFWVLEGPVCDPVDMISPQFGRRSARYRLPSNATNWPTRPLCGCGERMKLVFIGPEFPVEFLVEYVQKCMTRCQCSGPTPARTAISICERTSPMSL